MCPRGNFPSILARTVAGRGSSTDQRIGGYKELADMSIREFLGIKDNPKEPTNTKNEPVNKNQFTKAEAENVKKLHAKAEGGSRERGLGRQEKRTNFASRFGNAWDLSEILHP